tara:strand:- start:109 stop:399 length:291 start_codon:yes stop_codon:yes gene_type:complete
METIASIFDKFGGTRKMAEHLQEPPSTVNSWKRAGRIPAAKQPGVLRCAQRLGLDVGAEDVIYPLGDDGCHAHAVTGASVAQSSGKDGVFAGRGAA